MLYIVCIFSPPPDLKLKCSELSYFFLFLSFFPLLGFEDYAKLLLQVFEVRGCMRLDLTIDGVLVHS